MNIKAKLIVAAAAVSLLSTPALAFRDMGDAGGDSAFAVPEHHGYNRSAATSYRYGTQPRSAYASGQLRPDRPTQRQPQYQDWGGYQGWSGGHNDW